ncbi:MAG: hypothetical protein ACK4IK_08745 [Bacteroidia bacterium]
MKTFFAITLSTLISLNLLAQTPGLKISKATHRKTYSGASPLIIHQYQIILKKTIASDIKIESITAIADGNPIEFSIAYAGGKNNNKLIENNLIKAENKAALKIQFSQTEQGATDRRGRPTENNGESIDLSEGIKIVYTIEEKQYTVELKKFEELTPVKGK